LIYLPKHNFIKILCVLERFRVIRGNIASDSEAYSGNTQAFVGSRPTAEYIVKLSSTRSLIPEPIRVAHLIASGVALGESMGGA